MGNENTRDRYVPSETHQNSYNVFQQKPDNVSQQKPNNVFQQKPDNVSQQKPDNVSRQKPDNVSQQKPDNVSLQKPDNVSQPKPNNASQQEPNTSQQNNLTKAFNHRTSRSNSRHHGYSGKGNQKKNLNDFIKICDDFENALKTVEVCQRSTNSVHQRLLTIHKILVEKMSKLEQSNDDNSNRPKDKKNYSSNLRSPNKSLSSSTSSLHSKKSSKGLPNLISHKEFLKRVTCPFCNERQLDKYYLIKHLDEGCLPFKMKTFKIETNLPYSSFQILPKNSFKCNICPNVVEKDLNRYFNHLNSSRHNENFKQCSSKSYTDSLFCSVCKLLVPNNFTELIMHLEHQQHEKRIKKFVSERIFSEKKICCIYYNSGEYYCHTCSRKFTKQNNLMEFMDHLMDDKHKRNLERHGVNTTKLYCEVCEKEINQLGIWDHFLSLEHGSKVFKKKGSQYYTLCMYCSSDFSDLTELSDHMTSGCKEIKILRNDGLIPGHEASVKSTEEGAAGNEEVKDGHSLFLDVPDDMDASDLKNFFENFGRVISFNKLPGSKVMVVFKERDAVTKILGFKKLMGNDSKMLIWDDSLLEKIENRSNQSDIECENNEENGTSDDDNGSSSDNEEMENLFKEVGSHLLKTIETMDSAQDDEILLISQMTLKATMTFSGFRGCQLFIPNETRLNLHCRFENHHYNSVLEDLVIKQNINRIEKDSVELNFGLSQVALGLIEKSPFWEQAECITASIPYVKCIHKRTRKSCLISFSDSDRELTDALSACLKENDFIKPFLLTLKLWLSSQKTFLLDIESPVIAVILFFLMSKSLVRPFSVPKHPVHLKISRALGDDGDLNKPVGNIPERDIQELFKMFLEFLNTFDFKKYAICFPLPKPVPRTIVTNVLKDKDYSHCSIWIMNTSCTWNYTADVREKDSRPFLNFVNKTLQEI